MLWISLGAVGVAPADTPPTTPEQTNARAKEAFSKANVHYALGEFATAADLYQEAYKLKPDAAFLYNAAQSYRLAGNHQRALVLYKNYVLFYPQQKNIPEAVAAYREAIRLDPRSTDAHNGLAITYAGSGRLEEARAEFQAIVEIDPESTIGYYNLATALANLDRDVEAAAALREVIRINPNHYNARYNIGELLRLEGKFDDSAAQFREYLRLAPDTPQNRRNINRARQFVEKFTGQ